MNFDESCGVKERRYGVVRELKCVPGCPGGVRYQRKVAQRKIRLIIPRYPNLYRNHAKIRVVG